MKIDKLRIKKMKSVLDQAGFKYKKMRGGNSRFSMEEIGFPKASSSLEIFQLFFIRHQNPQPRADSIKMTGANKFGPYSFRLFLLNLAS
jgi:hypothetical protein